MRDYNRCPEAAPSKWERHFGIGKWDAVKLSRVAFKGKGSSTGTHTEHSTSVCVDVEAYASPRCCAEGPIRPVCVLMQSECGRSLQGFAHFCRSKNARAGEAEAPGRQCQFEIAHFLGVQREFGPRSPIDVCCALSARLRSLRSLRPAGNAQRRPRADHAAPRGTASSSGRGGRSRSWWARVRQLFLRMLTMWS